MPPIEIGASRPVGPVQVNTAKTAGNTAAGAAQGTESAENVQVSGTQVERSSALDGGSSAPVDAQRVQVIRRAIETNSYPIIPTRIADAMIAAGMLLRTSQ